MPIGERIGQAYVRVILEGDDADFANQFNRMGRVFDQEMDGRSEEFWEGFEDEGQAAFRNIARDADRAFGRMYGQIRNRSALVGSDLRDSLTRNLDESFGRGIGEAVFRGISERFATGGLGSLERDLERIHDLTIQAVRDEARATEQAQNDELRRERLVNQERNRENQRRADFQRQLAAQAERDHRQTLANLRAVTAQAEQLSRLVERNRNNFILTTAEVEHFRAEVERLTPALQRAFDEDVIDARTFERLNRDLTEFNERLQHTDVVANRFNLSMRRVADRTGRVFGRGSRNDFLNFIGAFTRGFTLLIGAASEFGLRVGRIFLQGFSQAAEQGAGLLGRLAAGFGALGARAAAALRVFATPQGLAALVVGLPVVINLVGTLASLFVSLAGAATAVALAVGGALVGAIGILGALLLPVTFGIGGLVAAILSLDDASKQALKTAIKPFTDQMKILGQEVAKHAFAGLEQDARKLGVAFRDPAFKTFARDIGEGLAEVRRQLVIAFTSDNFKEFLQKIGPQIKQQLGSLTDTAIELGGALGGVFLAIQPAVDTFLGRLNGVITRFNVWANSTAGQAKLTEFFNRAEAALASIGRLAEEVGRAFAVMFNLGGGDAGIALIDSLTGKVRQFINFMRSNPQAVREFFADAVEIGRAFGTVIERVIGLFRALDSNFTRGIVLGGLRAIALALETIGGLINFLNFESIGRRFVAQMALIFASVQTLVSALANIPGRIGAPFRAAEGAMQGLSDRFASLTAQAETPIEPSFDNAPLFQAMETIQFTEEEMKALGIEFEKPKVANIPTEPFDTAIEKINQVVTASKGVSDQFKAFGGLAELTAFTGALAQGLGGLKEGGVQVPVRPTADPVSLGSIRTQITNAVSTAPAQVRPTMAPGALEPIKASLNSLKAGAVIPITAGGNAQAVIGRTKEALAGLVSSKSAINISAGGNAQAVIGRTKAALDNLMATPTAINISAGGNAQAVIGRTQTALNRLMSTPSRIEITAGGNAQAVIGRTKNALDDLPTKKTITISVKVTGSGAKYIKTGGIIGMARGGLTMPQNMAAGGFANFRQFIRPDVIAGESGREAVVPLSRPLSQVDPSVRMLSAIAQGKLIGGSGQGVRTIDQSGWTIISHSKDPETVAIETANYIAGSVT